MPDRIQEQAVAVLRFGGGLHSRASEVDIDAREAHDGENFALDLENLEFRNRKPFDKIGTTANTSEIRGFISLLQSDGSVHWAVQSGDKVYDWDGQSTFTEIATVSSSAKLRGRLEHNWQLDDKVLITDIALADVVMEWNGGLSTGDLVDVSFTNETGSAFGTFKAKYCFISRERAVFANIDDGNAFEHLIVGSKGSDYTQITVSNQPSSALSADDPWFLTQPDLYAINGMVEAFGEVVTSSAQGSLFRLTGSDAKDYAFVPLFPRSGAKGTEALAYVGNDIFYGRGGRLESVEATDRFGNVEQNDLSLAIADEMEDFDSWTTVYNSRLDRAYFFPDGASAVYVLHKALRGTAVSPWSKWTTQHALAFQPTAVMNMLDPDDGLEYVFMGDESGNIYRLEGSGSSGDGGSANIVSYRVSKLIEAQLDAQIYNVYGYVRYRKQSSASSLTLTFRYAGERLFNEELTVSLDAASGGIHYSNSKYYSDGNYYAAPFQGRLTRTEFVLPGASNEVQIQTQVEGTSDFAISEVGIRFEAAS